MLRWRFTLVLDLAAHRHRETRLGQVGIHAVIDKLSQPMCVRNDDGSTTSIWSDTMRIVSVYDGRPMLYIHQPRSTGPMFKKKPTSVVANS